MTTLAMTTLALRQLDAMKDGIAAIDLGVIGRSQYALDFVNGIAANIWRRSAAEVGTYGGWRWECASSYPQRVQCAELPIMEQLASRIAGVLSVRSR